MLLTASSAASILDRFRSAFTDLLYSEETEAALLHHENSRLLYHLVLAKETPRIARPSSPQRRFTLQVANIYLDEPLRRQHIFRGLLDLLEAHPTVAQVVVSNILPENRSWLNGFLQARGYHDKTTHCFKAL